MIVFSDFQNGLSSSKYIQRGFPDASNLDIHAQLGTAQPQLALVSESTTPNEPCVQATAADGTVYFFSKTSGKTWKRTTSGTFSLVHTNANGAHISAFYSPSLDKIIYTTSTKVGHLVASTDTFTDSFGTFSNGSSYHPIADVNLTVFIGDGKYCASISQSLVFSANALDIPSRYSITCLKPENNWLLIGTIIGENISLSTVYLWDTYSSSWTTDDDVYEVGINAFIPADNITYAQCGTNGNFYYWNGSRMVFYETLETATSVGQEKVTVLNGKPLIAIGTGIYSLYKKSRNSNHVLCHEYTGSSSIHSIGVTGTQLLVHTGTEVMKIGTNYATATITTPIFFFDRESTVNVLYESMPSGCSLELESNINGEGWVTETGFTKDETNMKYYLDGGFTFDGKMKFGQCRVTLNPSATTYPIIQAISIL